ncbi:MAG: chorismate synthase [Clostridia bacterium]
MSSIWGKTLKISLFGEAHGPIVGGTLHNFPAGIPLNMDRIKLALKLRQGNANFTHARKEEDRPKILSGISRGITNGAPITVIFTNKDDGVIDFNAEIPRPSCADYVAEMRYGKNVDTNGGGHMGGRLTLPLVFFGTMALDFLSRKGIEAASHIKAIGDTLDEPFPTEIDKALIDRLNSSTLATISPEVRKKMVSLISSIKAVGDSIGGIIESAVIGLPPGIGSPVFENLESRISSILFAIPAVKGVSFGHGFDFAHSRGSSVNDTFIQKDGKVVTQTNFNGGLNRGITNGMPVLINTVLKPTPSISQPQRTWDFEANKIVDLTVKGNHMPCLAPRANIVVTSAVAIAVMDAYIEAFGYKNS